MTNVWDQFPTSDFVEFANVGDKVRGRITSIGAKKWDDGKVSPQLGLMLADGTEITLTAGWVMLVAELKKQAPNVGDTIEVTMTGIGPKPKETRSWGVVVERAGAAAAVTPTPQVAAAAAAVPAPAAGASASTASVVATDPLAGLTPEQRAALGLPPLAAATPAWDADPRVAGLRAMGLADEAIRTALGI